MQCSKFPISLVCGVAPAITPSPVDALLLADSQSSTTLDGAAVTVASTRVAARIESRQNETGHVSLTWHPEARVA